MNTILKFLTNKQGIEQVKIPANMTVCKQGDICENFVVLTKGKVKVFQIAEDGRHFTLYQINPGEACVLTASCILNEQGFPAFAVTEQDSEGLVISAKQLKTWLNSEPEWQAFIFGLLTQRMGDLIETIDQLAFNSLETRLIQWLIKHPQSPSIKITHQQVADELASSREVVSRILKLLERKEIITLQRGQICLRNILNEP